MIPLVKDSTKPIPPQILALRSKIHDEYYVDGAIQRIAQVLSTRIVENHLKARK
ncbi:MAG: hypothetical protein ACRC5H_08130 [Treponemataceae bacterium]